MSAEPNQSKPSSSLSSASGEELLPCCESPPEDLHLSGLNREQAKAVSHFRGPLLIMAGAGSGKTRVLTRRVAHLVLNHGIAPHSILAVTFTNKATQEMRERLHNLLGDKAERVWVSTFHAAGLRMLRRHAPLLGYHNDFVVYDEQDAKVLMKGVFKELGISEKESTPEQALRYIDQAKNAYVLPDEAVSTAVTPRAKQSARIYDEYQKALLRAGAMDFGDLLLNALLLLERNPEVLRLYQQALEFLLVDEFQDTNEVQYRFVRLLAAPRNNILVVGDDDQSIYSFRGASVKNILNFERDFPNAVVVKLEQNYRSSGNVLGAAYEVIKHNKMRKAKQLWTSEEDGERLKLYIAPDEEEEAAFVAEEIQSHISCGGSFKDIAIFYRTNAQSRALEEALLRAQVPYKIFGGFRFYERKEVKDILAYLRLVLNRSDEGAFLRTINTPARGIGPQGVQKIVAVAREKGCSLFQAATMINQAKRSTGLVQFISIVEDLAQKAESYELAKLVDFAVERTAYVASFKTGKDPEDEASRIENLRELAVSAARLSTTELTPIENLRKFLDHITLSASSDTPHGTVPGSESKSSTNEFVSLMTLHLAKGLEFPLVFLTGMEEGLLPHYRSLMDPTAIEEERRLCYVGITRAMRTLYLTRTITRGMFSAGDGFGLSGMYRMESRFLRDIPPRYVQIVETQL